MPLTMPEPRYFSIPSSVVGGAELRKAARNWRPWTRSLTHVPLTWTNSPAVIAAAAPTGVTGSQPGAGARPTAGQRHISPASDADERRSDKGRAAGEARGPVRAAPSNDGTTRVPAPHTSLVEHIARSERKMTRNFALNFALIRS